MWLPPGGHIEPNELPDEAALREVIEETGIRARLCGEGGPPLAYPVQLVRPEAIQLEAITPDHEHVDLIYFAVPLEDASRDVLACPECERAGWYRQSELAALGANDEIRYWSARAIATVAARVGRRAPAGPTDAIGRVS